MDTSSPKQVGHSPDTKDMSNPSKVVKQQRQTRHLTDVAIRRIPTPATGNKVHYDDEVGGFGCRVTAAGARSFVLNYLTKVGRERRYTIGSCSDWSDDRSSRQGRTAAPPRRRRGRPLGRLASRARGADRGRIDRALRGGTSATKAYWHCRGLSSHARGYGCGRTLGSISSWQTSSSMTSIACIERSPGPVIHIARTG